MFKQVQKSRQKKIKKAQDGKPVHPLNAFNIFWSENNGVDASEVRLKWKAMSESEKAAYAEKSKKDVERY